MQHCEDTADFFRVMANSTRLMLICHIAKGECAVAELERELGLRQPGLSQQLGELRQKGLLQSRRESRSIFYSISDPRILPVLSALHDTLFELAKAVPVATPPSSGTAKVTIHRSLGEHAQFARVVRDPP
jgi:ArsR family transcriptional regulator